MNQELTVTLSAHEWRIVTASILCKHYHEKAKGADELADEAREIRAKVRGQISDRTGVKDGSPLADKIAANQMLDE